MDIHDITVPHIGRRDALLTEEDRESGYVVITWHDRKEQQRAIDEGRAVATFRVHPHDPLCLLARRDG